MHRKEVIHRDIKLENIVLSHVKEKLCRVWLKYAILDGVYTVQESLEIRSVELLYICLLKFSWECITTKR